MAHIGRSYRLHFRRDLCLGCNDYQQSFPAAFLIVFGMDVPLPTDRHFEMNMVPAIATGDLRGPEPTWETSTVTQHGITYSVRIVFDGYDFPNQTTKMRFEFIVGGDVAGELRMIQWQTTRCFRWHGNSSGLLNVLWLDEEIWGWDGGSSSQEIVAQRWEDL